jgi:hypothetical protein
MSGSRYDFSILNILCVIVALFRTKGNKTARPQNLSVFPHASRYADCPIYCLAATALCSSTGQAANAKVFKSMGTTGPGKYLNSILKRFGELFNLDLTSHSARHSAVDEANEHWMVMIHWVIMRGDWTLDAISTFFEYASFSSKSDRKVARSLSGYAMVDRGGHISSLEAISDVEVRKKVADLAKTIFAAPVPERYDQIVFISTSLQKPFICTLLMHYNAAKELKYITSTLEFRFENFGITTSQMEAASDELKADFVLKNIESLPTENSGMPQSITTKLAEIESHVRTMQVSSARMCQEMRDIAQANIRFQQQLMDQQATHTSFMTRGFNHLQAVIVSVGTRLLSAFMGGGAIPQGLGPAADPIITALDDLAPPDQPATDTPLAVNTSHFPDMYLDIKSKSTVTALTDMLVSRIHLRSMKPGSTKLFKENRQILMRFANSAVQWNDDWRDWFECDIPATGSPEYVPWNRLQKQRAACIAAVVYRFRLQQATKKFNERTQIWEAKGDAKGKPRLAPVGDTISASDKAIRLEKEAWLEYREVEPDYGPLQDIPLEDEQQDDEQIEIDEQMNDQIAQQEEPEDVMDES